MTTAHPFRHNDFAVLWWVRDHCEDWSSREKLAFVMLYLRAGHDLLVRPSKSTLGRDMSCTRETARAAVKDLMRRGVLQEVEPEKFDPETGAQRPAVYRILPPWTGQEEGVPNNLAGVPNNLAGVPKFLVGGSQDSLQGVPNESPPPCQNSLQEEYQYKSTKEDDQQKPPTATAGLPSGLFQELQTGVGKRLVLLKASEVVSQFGELRARYAAARVAEEQEQRIAAGQDALVNPVGRFISIARQSTDEEAAAFFEEQAKDRGRGRAEANTYYTGPLDPDDEDSPNPAPRQPYAPYSRSAKSEVPPLPRRLGPRTSDSWD